MMGELGHKKVKLVSGEGGNINQLASFRACVSSYFMQAKNCFAFMMNSL